MPRPSVASLQETGGTGALKPGPLLFLRNQSDFLLALIGSQFFVLCDSNGGSEMAFQGSDKG
jgi:hypothetical protein